MHKILRYSWTVAPLELRSLLIKPTLKGVQQTNSRWQAVQGNTKLEKKLSRYALVYACKYHIYIYNLPSYIEVPLISLFVAIVSESLSGHVRFSYLGCECESLEFRIVSKCVERSDQTKFYIVTVYHLKLFKIQGDYPGIIRSMTLVNERRRYIAYTVTSPLIGWAHTQKDPCYPVC